MQIYLKNKKEIVDGSPIFKIHISAMFFNTRLLIPCMKIIGYRCITKTIMRFRGFKAELIHAL